MNVTGFGLRAVFFKCLKYIWAIIAKESERGDLEVYCCKFLTLYMKNVKV